MVELTLPFPPSQNHLWTRTKNGMRCTDRYRAWLKEAGWLIQAKRPQPIKGPYKLSVQAVRPDNRKRDLDNFAFKAISDLIVELGIVQDDSLCEMISARWVTVGEGVTVRIEPAGVE